MITVFNRAKLCNEMSATEAADMRSVLEAAGIPCITKRVSYGASKPGVRISRGGRTGNMFSGNVYAGGAVPHSWVEDTPTTGSCAVYVRKKDYANARKLCGLD
ncbi:MAG: hypothetical protein J6112_09800 [Clostridia bacterium]|nr:hypothetical protein [Clostridia bacterium]